MTDNEIIKALECCSNAEPCTNCPYQKQCDETDLAEIALDLINRQKAEIERLEKGSLKEAMTFNSKTIANIKVEAVKEFAEELIRRLYLKGDMVEEINNLVKEMEGK